MIYPDEFNCLVCRKRYYGCKHGKEYKWMVSCVHFVRRPVPKATVPSLALHRCLCGVCPVLLIGRMHGLKS